MIHARLRSDGNGLFVAGHDDTVADTTHGEHGGEKMTINIAGSLISDAKDAY